jgi:hypothetical protein
MKNDKKACDLCGLTIEVDLFSLHTQEGDKDFCCEGCQGIYQMLHEDLILTSENDKTNE